MKIYHTLFCFSLIFPIIFISSCTQSTENAAIPSPIHTVPISSSTSTLIPIATDTPTSVPTPTNLPTLPVEEAGKILLGLLANNGDCHLPCLWGIVMGKSTYQEAQASLLSLSSISELTSFTPESGAIFPAFKQDDLEIYVTVGFLTNPSTDIVNHVAFTVEAHKSLKEGGYENVFDSKFFAEKVSVYMLPQILSKQGIPESVLMRTSGAPLTRGGTGGFNIVLLYPSQGIFVHYTTQMYINEKNVRGCLQDAHVWMELYPPGDTLNFFAQLEKTNWPFLKNGFKPLDDVTSISVEEFYETFRVPTDKCIETPASLWTTPEP